MLFTRVYCNKTYIEQIVAYNSRMSLGYSILSIEDAPFDIVNQLLHESFQENQAYPMYF